MVVLQVDRGEAIPFRKWRGERQELNLVNLSFILLNIFSMLGLFQVVTPALWLKVSLRFINSVVKNKFLIWLSSCLKIPLLNIDLFILFHSGIQTLHLEVTTTYDIMAMDEC